MNDPEKPPMPHGLNPSACIVAIAVLLLALLAPLARAATPAGTGDAWVDATLADIDRYAARYPDAFSDELVRYHGAPRALVAQLRESAHWQPGDIYFACVTAQMAGQPCRRVVEQRNRNPGQAWDAIARGFGVGAGSRGFRQLKRALVESYARWARPLQVDASLHREFPKLPLAPATKPADARGNQPPASKAKPAHPARVKPQTQAVPATAAKPGRKPA
jgi:hypothetical protein